MLRNKKARVDKILKDTDGRLKKFCQLKGISFIEHDNLDKKHLGIKKLHLNNKDYAAFAKNILNLVLSDLSSKFREFI